jgi:hypothetical protein
MAAMQVAGKAHFFPPFQTTPRAMVQLCRAEPPTTTTTIACFFFPQRNSLSSDWTVPRGMPGPTAIGAVHDALFLSE